MKILQTAAPLLHPRFQYTDSTRTNVARTFERFGWQRPDPAQQRMLALALNGIAIDAMTPTIEAA